MGHVTDQVSRRMYVEYETLVTVDWNTSSTALHEIRVL